jgi:hypothetical protein
MMDVGKLRSCLPATVELPIPELAHLPEGKHPVIVEIWRVRDGLIQFGEQDAHQIWEMTSGATGATMGFGAGSAYGAGIGGAAGAANGMNLGMWLGPFGACWGAAAGAAAGATMGAAMMASAGAMQAARWAAIAGRKTSERNSRSIGTYNEILITVPCRRHKPGVGMTNYSYVLATYTDSPASMIGEWLVGWGYRKSPALGWYGNDGSLEVKVRASHRPFRVTSRPGASESSASFLRHANSQVPAVMSYPILGILKGERLTVSFLDRCFDSPSTQVRPATVQLEGDDGLVPGLGDFDAMIPGFAPGLPWGAFLITGLPVTLSYPRDVDA